MTEKQLYDVVKIISRFKDEIDWMPIKDVEDLEATVSCELYAERIKAFYQHVVDSLPRSPEDWNDADDLVKYEEEMDEFYNKPITISFNGKSVSIDMCATVYSNVVDLLKTHIEEEL